MPKLWAELYEFAMSTDWPVTLLTLAEECDTLGSALKVQGDPVAKPKVVSTEVSPSHDQVARQFSTRWFL
jgi:hypothetical protein